MRDGTKSSALHGEGAANEVTKKGVGRAGIERGDDSERSEKGRAKKSTPRRTSRSPRVLADSLLTRSYDLSLMFSPLSRLQPPEQYLCACTCLYACVRVCVCAWACAYLCACICACAYARTRACVVCVCACVCMSVCVCV